MDKVETGVRRLEYTGKSQDHAILIGNHGNVHFTARGDFELSGSVYCPKYTMKVIVSGSGKVTLQGICKILIVVKMDGTATLDLTQLTCKEMRCTAVSGKTHILVGKTRMLSHANVQKEALITLTQSDTIVGSSVMDNPQVVRQHPIAV